MHVERLTKLAELLDRVEAEKKPFDIRWWIVPLDCGYAACAIGHAMFDPWFIEQGLTGQDDVCPWEDGPVYGDLVEFDAVKSFFDIPLNLALYLFCGSNYGPGTVTATEVAHRIRTVIADPADLDAWTLS